jgi:hypothetical protein
VKGDYIIMIIPYQLLIKRYGRRNTFEKEDGETNGSHQRTATKQRTKEGIFLYMILLTYNS